MYRGLILGACACAFAAAALIAERQSITIRKDIERYDRMREMSGDKPLLGQGLDWLVGAIGSFGNSRRGTATGILDALQRDIVRYARISTM